MTYNVFSGTLNLTQLQLCLRTLYILPENRQNHNFVTTKFRQLAQPLLVGFQFRQIHRILPQWHIQTVPSMNALTAEL